MNKFKYCLLVLIIIILQNVNLSAQVQSNWLNYTSNESIGSLLNSQNELWIAMGWGGVIRYNYLSGTYTKYTVRDGMLTQSPVGFAKTTDGRIWTTGERSPGLSMYNAGIWTKVIGTSGDEVSYYSICTDNSFIYLGRSRYTIGNGTWNLSFASAISTVNVIKKDENNNIWYGGDILMKYNTSGVFSTFDTLNSGILTNYTNDIAFDNQNNIWAAHNYTKSGLSYYNQSSNLWQRFDTTNSGVYTSKISDITVDNNNNLWGIAYSNRQKRFLIIRYDGTNWYKYDSTNVPLLNLERQYGCIHYSSYDSAIYIGTTKYWNRSNGLLAGGGKIIKYKNGMWSVFLDLNANQIPLWGPNCLTKGKNEKLVIGSVFGGVSMLDSSNWITYDHTNAPFTNDYVRSVAINNSDDLWALSSGYSISSSGWGMYVQATLMKRINNVWTKYNENDTIFGTIKVKDINATISDSNGVFWFGTNKGLLKRNGSNWNLYDSLNSGLPENKITTIKIDDKKNFWLSTNNYIIKYKDSTLKIVNKEIVQDFDIDTVGNIWGYGARSIGKYENNNWTYTTVPTQYGSPTCISKDIDSRYVWFGSQYKGVVKTNLTTWVNYLPRNSGLGGLYIDDIYVDNKNNKYFYGSNGVGLSIFNENGITGIEPYKNLYKLDFSLSQNYPNPFNSSTRINFTLSSNNFVKLVVYDIIGREVEVLKNCYLKTGTYDVTWNANNYASGIYLCKLQSGDKIETRRMIIIK